MVWNLITDGWADWSLCWLGGLTIPQSSSPETLQWTLRLQMTSATERLPRRNAYWLKWLHFGKSGGTLSIFSLGQ